MSSTARLSCGGPKVTRNDTEHVRTQEQMSSIPARVPATPLGSPDRKAAARLYPLYERADQGFEAMRSRALDQDLPARLQLFRRRRLPVVVLVRPYPAHRLGLLQGHRLLAFERGERSFERCAPRRRVRLGHPLKIVGKVV